MASACGLNPVRCEAADALILAPWEPLNPLPALHILRLALVCLRFSDVSYISSLQLYALRGYEVHESILIPRVVILCCEWAGLQKADLGSE